jgi:hypothetical protein
MRDEFWLALFLTTLTYCSYTLTKLVYAVLEVIFK